MNPSTTLFHNPALASMRALVTRALPLIEWRHHGIGVLQGYLAEDQEPEIRIHIWCKRLIKPGMDASGDIHDHRFDMISHVLSGVIGHEEISPTADANGDHRMLMLTHARAAADTNYHGPTTPIEGAFRVSRLRYTIPAGGSYLFPARIFHRSPLTGADDDVAVTVVEKHNQANTPARILYPQNCPPVMAFGHEIDDELVRHVVNLGRKSLEGIQP